MTAEQGMSVDEPGRKTPGLGVILLTVFLDLVGFSIIWLALAVFAVEGGINGQRNRTRRASLGAEPV